MLLSRHALLFTAALSWGCADADGAPDLLPDPAGLDVDAAVEPTPDAGCEPAPELGAEVVRVNDAQEFEVDGRAFVARGVNSYPLLQHAGRGRLDAIDDIFEQAVALGRPLVRTPAFLDIGENPARIRADDGSLREEGLVALDRVLARAAEHGVRLLLILTNNWGDFGGAPALVELIAPGEKLPKNAFWSDPRAIALQLAYQRALAERVNTINQRPYAQDPTIFAWELANEARCERATTPALCDELTLARWARRMSDGLRDAGVAQLIAWGGGSGREDYGDDLRPIAERGGVDVLTLHMYGSSVVAAAGQSRAQTAIGWGERLLHERADLARELGLPLLLEEVNWKPAAGGDRDGERAQVLGAWLSIADELGVGSLPWMIGELGREVDDGYLIRPEDLESTRVITCE